MEGQRFLRAGRGLGRGMMRGGFPFRGRGIPIDGIRPGAPRPGMLRGGPPPLFARGLHGPRPLRPMGPNGPLGMLGRPPIPPPGSLGPRGGMMPRPPGMGLRSLVPHTMEDDDFDSDEEIDSLIPEGGGGPVRSGGMKGSPAKGMRGGTGQRRGRGRPGAQRGTMRGSMQARGDASAGGQSDFGHEENSQADQNIKTGPSQRGSRGKRGGNQGMRGDGNQGGNQITPRVQTGRPPIQSSAPSTHPSNSNSVQTNPVRGNRGNLSQRGGGPMGRGMEHNVRPGALPPLLGNRGGMMGGQPPMAGIQPPSQFPPAPLLPPSYGMGPSPIAGPYSGSGGPPAYNNPSIPQPQSSIKRTSGVNNQQQANKRIRYDAPTATNGVQPFQSAPQPSMHPDQYMDYGIGGVNNSHGNQRPRYDTTVPEGYPQYHGASVSTYPPYEPMPTGDMYGVPPGTQSAQLYGNPTGYDTPMLNTTTYGQGNVAGQYASSTVPYDGSGYMNPYPTGFDVQPTVDYNQAPLQSTDNPYSYSKQATGNGGSTTEGYSYSTTSTYPTPVATYEDYTTGYIDPSYTTAAQDASYGQQTTYTGGYTY